MKKKWIFSALAALMLLLTPASAAFAEETAVPESISAAKPLELGSFSAGEDMECPVRELTEEETPETDDLPDGLELTLRETVSGTALFLTGRPMVAGSYTFAIPEGEESILYSLQITPAVPFVDIGGDLSCWTGDEVVLRATATTADAGTLSYQWYLEDGMNTRPLAGETDVVFRPDTSVPGAVHYCCEVTNTNNGLAAAALSDRVTLTVCAPDVSSVSIETMPAKMDYLTGEDFDPAGLSLRVIYNNGSQEIITEGYELSYDLFDTAGTHLIKVSYGGHSWSFYANVKQKEASVSGIGVASLPNKREYVLGDKLQTKGLSIRVYTDDGEHSDVSEGFECSPTTLNTEGEQTVTVKYSGKTCTFKVTVKNDKVVTGISVLTQPYKRDYTVGDYLNTDGLSVQLNSNKGSELLSGGYSVSPKVMTTPGTQEITVRYEKYSAKFTVSVKAKDSVTPTPGPASPSASPSVSPGEATVTTDPSPDSSPDPAATARPVASPTRRNTGVNGVVKVFFALAVLALAGLAGYVWYLRKTGFDGEESAASGTWEEMPSLYGEPVEPESPKTPWEGGQSTARDPASADVKETSVNAKETSADAKETPADTAETPPENNDGRNE